MSIILAVQFFFRNFIFFPKIGFHFFVFRLCDSLLLETPSSLEGPKKKKKEKKEKRRKRKEERNEINIVLMFVFNLLVMVFDLLMIFFDLSKREK